jgi:hypothetical protein
LDKQQQWNAEWKTVEKRSSGDGRQRLLSRDSRIFQRSRKRSTSDRAVEIIICCDREKRRDVGGKQKEGEVRWGGVSSAPEATRAAPPFRLGSNVSAQFFI